MKKSHRLSLTPLPTFLFSLSLCAPGLGRGARLARLYPSLHHSSLAIRFHPRLHKQALGRQREPLARPQRRCLSSGHRRNFSSPPLPSDARALSFPPARTREFASACVLRPLNMTAARGTPCPLRRRRGQRRTRGAAKAAAKSIGVATMLLFFSSCLASLTGVRAQPQLLAVMTLTVSCGFKNCV
jgi:hypothetical protein